MTRLNSRDGIVFMLLSVFAIWSLISLALVPGTLVPVSLRETVEAGSEKLHTQNTVSERGGASRQSAEEFRPDLSLQSFSPILVEAIVLANNSPRFPGSSAAFLSGLTHPSGSLTLVIASQSHDYQSVLSKYRPLQSVCLSPNINCVVFMPVPDDLGAMQGFLPDAYLPWVLVSSLDLQRVIPELTTREQSVVMMLFGSNGALIYASRLSDRSSTRAAQDVARTSLILLSDPELLGVYPSNDLAQINDLPSSGNEEVGGEEAGGDKKVVVSPRENPVVRDKRHDDKVEEEPETYGKIGVNEGISVPKEVVPVNPGSKASITLAGIKYKIYNSRNGAETRLGAWAGSQRRPVVLTFWATYCIPCREEFPIISSLAKRYKNVLFIGMADGDASQKSYKEIQDFLTKSGASEFPNYVFPESQLQVDLVGSRALPAFAVFDEEGGLVGDVEGAITKDKYLAELMMLLDEVSGAKPK